MRALGQTGIAARIRMQLAAWKLARSQSEREARALITARQLDADEVGRRADRRREERGAQSAAGSAPVPSDADASAGAR